MTSTKHITECGQTVSEVLGQPGRVITGRPRLTVLHNPNLVDPFAAFDEQAECLTCPDGMACVCTASSDDPPDYVDGDW